MHVLAVDDDADAVTLVAELLQAAGARVSTAASAHDALRVMEAELPQVLVTDRNAALMAFSSSSASGPTTIR